MSYEQLLTERVLAPLRMGATAVTVPPERVDQLMVGHSRPWPPVSAAPRLHAGKRAACGPAATTWSPSSPPASSSPTALWVPPSAWLSNPRRASARSCRWACAGSSSLAATASAWSGTTAGPGLFVLRWVRTRTGHCGGGHVEHLLQCRPLRPSPGGERVVACRLTRIKRVVGSLPHSSHMRTMSGHRPPDGPRRGWRRAHNPGE